MARRKTIQRVIRACISTAPESNRIEIVIEAIQAEAEAECLMQFTEMGQVSEGDGGC